MNCTLIISPTHHIKLWNTKQITHTCAKMRENNSSRPVSNVLSDDEDTPLLAKTSWWSRCVQRYKTTRKCISSKSALLILCWSFALGLWNGVALNPDVYLRNYTVIYTLAGYGFVAIVFCFFPLAGFLADVKYGRYKVVVRSLYVFLLSVPLLAMSIGVCCYVSQNCFDRYDTSDTVGILAAYGNVAFAFGIMSYVGLVGFAANVVQFGMDQLHDSPGEDRTLFIHWYVWVYFVTIAIGQLAWNLTGPYYYNYYNNIFISSKWYDYAGFVLLPPIPFTVILLLIITLCLAKRRSNWFLIEPGTVNPYKLVYRVTKFARQHKTPVRRSAFTYCEDEIPTGLDLGKEKYGGPFSTEQVEDVKVFYGILKVLFSFGAVFFLDFAASSVLPLYALHSSWHWYSYYYYIYVYTELKFREILLINCSLLSPLLIAICLPLHLCLLRPLISPYVPGMLKRMGLGIIFILFSLLASFAMDFTAHHKDNFENSTHDICMFLDPNNDYLYNLPQQNSLLLIVPLVLTSLSHMLIYTAVFEFICSQSPHSMKCLLIGMLYAIKGLYQLLATILVVPFAVGYTYHPSHISCGFYYYLVNIVIGLIAVLTYMWVAKKYKY